MDAMSRPCSANWESRNVCRILVEKLEGNNTMKTKT